MIQRFIITIVLIVCFACLPTIGFGQASDMTSHFMYPFCHANVFHLLANILCLWMLSCPLYIFVCYAIAVLCSFFPCFVSEDTMGCSGILFAIAGISWGRIHRFKGMCRKCLPFVLITFILPHVNALIHVYCLLLGYLYGTLGINDWLSEKDPYNPKFIR